MRNGLVKHSTSPELRTTTQANPVHTIMFNFYDLFACLLVGWVFFQMASNLTVMGAMDFCMLKLFFWNKINQNNPWRTTLYFVTELLCQREIYKRLSQKKASIAAYIFEKLSTASATKGAQQHFTGANPLERFSAVTHLMFPITSLQILKRYNLPEDWLVHSL